MVKTVTLAPLDWVVIALFLVGILALGFSAKLRNNSVLQFIAAGRSLTLPVFVATLVSTWYGGILGVGETVAMFGIGTWVLIGLPYYVFAAVYAVFLARKVRDADQISIPERLELRYGKKVALLGAALVFMLAIPSVHVLMLGTLVQFASGMGLVASVLIGTAIGTAFLYRGGLLADARVSLLAFVMMYVGFATILCFCLVHYPPASAFDALRSQTPAFFTWDGGSGFTVVLSFFILGAWTLVDPGFHQRVASCESPRVSKQGVFVSIIFWFLFDVLSIGTGMYAVAIVKDPPKLMAYPLLGDQVLPPGLKAVFLCGMVGTILSAMVGYTLVSGATVGREVVARLRPGLSDAAIENWTRLGFAFACLCAIILALLIESVVDLWYAWGGAVVGALLIPVALAYAAPRRRGVSSRWVFWAMAAAFGVSLGGIVYGIRTNDLYLTVPILGRDFSVGTLLPGLLVSGLIVGIGEFIGRRRLQDD